MTIQFWQLLAVGGCVLLALEMLTGTFVFMSLAIGCFATAAAFQILMVRSGAELALVFGASSAGSAFILTRVLGPNRFNRDSDVNDY